MTRVLVFPGGTEIGLELRQALMFVRDIELHSVADDSSNHAPYTYLRHEVVPSITEAGWLDAIREYVQKHRIDYVFGAHEDVLLELARHEDELGATLVAPTLDVLETARSKSRTYGVLQGVVRVPRVYDPATVDASLLPLFVKPDRGAGSRGASVIRSMQELQSSLSVDEDMLVSEYLPGDELTVDCLSDRDAGVLYCQPRIRVRMRDGISMDSFPVDEPEALEISRAIQERIPLRGAWFFQLKKSASDEWVLLEVGARIGGTMAVSRCSGVNLPLLSMYEAERRPIKILKNPQAIRIDRALVNRFSSDLLYSAVYVDLDDTLLIGGRVNTTLIRFLYQALNAGHRLVLVTRHAGDLAQTLAQHRLTELFDQVHHLGPDERKSHCIAERDAILIDDSFGERLEVFDALGIATFDCSMLEVLIDERV